ncbi:MAG: type I-U CRISPR-associated protein Cas5/Cas6, partial [Planctomycetes bacterium]|nr:type I-U CRISPR-associated protein Cas5/Cas6 [Planctomycetota bacterium]
MSQFLCASVRFLQPFSHGRGEDAEPEWPPSPLRLFQALVAAAAARWNERMRIEYAQPALQWLAQLGNPVVVAAKGDPAPTKYRLYVPDNVGDRVAKSWASGNSAASIAEYRTEKDVRPVHLNGEAVHYLFPIADVSACGTHFETLRTAARSVTHLGWGVDMVAGNAELLSDEQAAKLEGERWQPTADGSGTRLRVPRAGTLAALINKHTAFLNRLSEDGFRPVPPLTAFDVVGYRRDTDLAERPFAAFELRTPDFERFQPYNPARWTGAVAGMVRNAVATLAGQMRPFGWTDAHINTFVHGHTPDGNDRAHGSGADARFSYLPLPSLERRGDRGTYVGAIRRVLIVAPPQRRDAVVWSRVLSGQELVPLESTDTCPAALRLIDRPAASLQSDANLGPYVGESRVWSTVTPVVLPGYDDPTGIRRRLSVRNPAPPMNAEDKLRQLTMLNQQTRDLLLRAFAHAGIGPGLLSAELLDRGDAELDWRDVGFRAGLDLARHYHLGTATYPRYHVRVRFADPVRGPLAVGTGRYRGL